MIYLPMKIEISKLESGYWLIRGNGPCEWAQVPNWPTSEQRIRDNSFPEASEMFIRAAAKLAQEIR